MATIDELGMLDNPPGLQQSSIRTKTTDGRVWIVPEREIDKKVEVHFVIPEIAITRQANVQGIAIVGRNNPFYQYTSGETTMPWTLDFYAQDSDRKDVLRVCRFLESLAANNGYKNPPQRVRIIFGDVFRDEMWVIKKVTYRLSNFDKQHGFMPKQGYVDLDLALDTKMNLTTDEIRRV